jgi:hypothetical protein
LVLRLLLQCRQARTRCCCQCCCCSNGCCCCCCGFYCSAGGLASAAAVNVPAAPTACCCCCCCVSLKACQACVCLLVCVRGHRSSQGPTSMVLHSGSRPVGRRWGGRVAGRTNTGWVCGWALSTCSACHPHSPLPVHAGKRVLWQGVASSVRAATCHSLCLMCLAGVCTRLTHTSHHSEPHPVTPHYKITYADPGTHCSSTLISKHC